MVRTWQGEGRESSSMGLGLVGREASLGQSLKPREPEGGGCVGVLQTKILGVFPSCVSLFSHPSNHLSIHTQSLVSL